jgi:hypothetical protein
MRVKVLDSVKRSSLICQSVNYTTREFWQIGSERGFLGIIIPKRFNRPFFSSTSSPNGSADWNLQSPDPTSWDLSAFVTDSDAYYSYWLWMFFLGISHVAHFYLIKVTNIMLNKWSSLFKNTFIKQCSFKGMILMVFWDMIQHNNHFKRIPWPVITFWGFSYVLTRWPRRSDCLIALTLLLGVECFYDWCIISWLVMHAVLMH